MSSQPERERRHEARRRWAIYRQYLHVLSPEFLRDWGEVVALRVARALPLDTPLAERVCIPPAVAAATARLRQNWPEAPWDLHELRPDEFWNPVLSPPADPSLREAWARHRQALAPARGRRIKEPKAPLTMARQCFVGCHPWPDLPATSIYYRRLVVWDLRHAPEWASRPDRELWAIAVTLFPLDDTVSALLEANFSDERNDLKKKLTRRMLRYLEEVKGDLASLPGGALKVGRSGGGGCDSHAGIR